MARPRIEVFRSLSVRRSQRWAWRLRAPNGRIVAVSGEGYGGRGEALGMAAAVAQGAYSDAAVES